MGLPIFLLPVESDLPQKPSSKVRSTSPPRTSIRRQDRDHRPRRAVRLYGTTGRPPTNARASPWAEPPTTDAPGSESQLGRSREVLREMSTRFDSRRRERIEEQMSSIFGGNWADGSQANDRYESDLGWWSIDSQSRLMRPRHAPTPAPPFHTTRMNPSTSRQPRHTLTPNEDTPSSRVTTSRRAAPMMMSPMQRAEDVIDRFNRTEATTGQASWGDGLGDRERSLSPEVWDTLLTTLTPDPQPPSVNTSFASAAPTSGPSQSSVSTATTLPPPSVLAGEDHCEPGWDTAEGDDSARDRMERRRTTQQGQELDMERRPEGTTIFGIRVHRRDRNPSGRPSGNAQRTQDSQSSMSGLGRQGDSWVGRALMDAAESRESEGARRQAREASSGATTAAGHGEDDIAGMQHIVRSLARREDIPDDWWAEVGLSRTLPQEGSN